MAKTPVDTLGVYIPRGVDKKRLRAGLSTLCAALGYIAESGAGKGQGSIGTLLLDLDHGDALVVRVDDYQHVVVSNWLRQQIDAIQARDLDDTTLEDWLLHLLEQMGQAFERRHTQDDPG